MKIKLLLPFILILHLSTSLNALTLYLSPDGNDDVEPVEGAVFKTFAGVLPHLWAGDTLIVKKGVYEGGFHIRRGAHENAPLIIKGEPGALIKGSGDSRDAVNLHDCEHVIIDGLAVTSAKRAGIYLDHGKFITIRNCHTFDNGKWGIFTNHTSDFILENNECSGSGIEHGIYHSNSGDNFIVRGNIIHHNNANGLHVNGDPAYGGDGVISKGIIEGNIIFANGKAGGAAINMTHVQDVLVRNNLIYDNLSGAITFYQDTGTPNQGSKRALVLNNTIFFNQNEGRAPVILGMTTEKFAFYNNIVVPGASNPAYEINAINLPTILSDHNLIMRMDKKQAVFRFDGNWTNPPGLVDNEGRVHGQNERAAISDKQKIIGFQEWTHISGNDISSTVTELQGFLNVKKDEFSPTPKSPAIGISVDNDTIIRNLTRLGGYDWVISTLQNLPDSDINGTPRSKDFTKRAIGAFATTP